MRTSPTIRAFRVPLLAGLAVATAAARPALTAQQVFVPDANSAQGPAHNAPLGGKGPAGGFQWLRTQIRVPARFLPAGGSRITDLGLTAVETSAYTFQRLEVTLGHLPAGRAFSDRFADNLAPGAVQCLLRTDQRPVPVTRDRFTDLGLTTPFDHDGQRDLVVDVVVQGAYFQGTNPGTRRSSTLEAVFRTDYRLGQNPPATGSGPWLAGARLALRLDGGSTRIVGQGCPKADGTPPRIEVRTQPQLGGSLGIGLLEAGPPVWGGGGGPTDAILLLGADDTAFGPLTLPFDLAPAGAPGCLLRTDVHASTGVRIDSSGRAAFALPIPNTPSLSGARLLCQWAVPSPGANRLQLTMTAMLSATLP